MFFQMELSEGILNVNNLLDLFFKTFGYVEADFPNVFLLSGVCFLKIISTIVSIQLHENTLV